MMRQDGNAPLLSRAEADERYGVKLGPLFSNYNLTHGARFVDHVCKADLRFYGLTIGEWAIGVFVRRRRKAVDQ